MHFTIVKAIWTATAEVSMLQIDNQSIHVLCIFEEGRVFETLKGGFVSLKEKDWSSRLVECIVDLVLLVKS